MARPTSISNEQILDAARAVFLEQGFEASTAQIAREAGVSEGSIFKRFQTKEALFRAAMGIPELPIERLLEGRAGTGDVREGLVEISVEIIRFFRVLVPRLMRLWAHTCAHPMELTKGKESPPLRAHRLLTAYLAEEMERGRLRKTDPKVMARMLIGTLHNFVFFEVVGLKEEGDSEAFARDVVDLLWKGVAP